MSAVALVGLGVVLGVRHATDADRARDAAAPLSTAARRWPQARTWVRVATGALSLGFGAWLIVRSGVADGLFRDAARWMPR
jgi:hypothetical protein